MERKEELNNTLSLVIPMRNEAKYIDSLLKSIIAQQEKPDELIFVIGTDTHDGSEDRITRHLPDLAPISVQVHRLPPRGIAHARDHGSRRARGEIIAFTDGDSVLDKNWVRTVKQEMGTHEFIYGAVTFYQNNLPSYLFQQIGFKTFPHILPYFGLHAIVGSNMAITKEAFYRIGGFNVALAFAEDNDIGMRCSSRRYIPAMKISTSNRRQDSFRKVLWYLFACVGYLLGFRRKEYCPLP